MREITEKHYSHLLNGKIAREAIPVGSRNDVSWQLH
jgi:hypothetical protein